MRRARARLVVAVAAACLAGPAAALTLAPDFAAAPVASGLNLPTAARFAPDGRLFILEQAGRIQLWKPGAGLVATPALSLPSCDTSEMGLLGIAFDPAFAANGWLYLYHTHPPSGDLGRCGSAAGRENRIVRVTMHGDVADPASLVVLFAGIRTDNGNHDGGDLQIGPDGFLYAGVGDTGIGDRGGPGAATNPYAQDPASPNGKILRLTLTGAPAPGNPFAGRGGASDAVFARGLRNPWRFTFQPGTGLLWAGDVGQNTWEEIDVVRAGDNLGWPQCEGREPSPSCPGRSVPPVHQYGHGGAGASITGGVFYDGTAFAASYRGSYFFGDYVLDLIWRAAPNAANDGFASEPQVVARNAGAPVDFTVGPDGALYYVAFGDGEVRRIMQVGRPVAAEACSMRLGRAAPLWLRRAARTIAACTRRRGLACVPPPAARLAPATARLRRAIAKRCAPPPAALCERLACRSCADAAGLAHCGAPSALAMDLAERAYAGGPTGCAAVAFRAGIRLAARRASALARCAAGSGPCELGAGEARLAELVARRCPTPPRPLCAAFACDPCGGGRDLAACVTQAVSGAVDGFAARVYGKGG